MMDYCDKNNFCNSLNIQDCSKCPGGESCCGVIAGYFDGKPPVVKNARGTNFESLGIKWEMTKSEELWREGLKLIPCGSQTLGKSPIGFIDGVAPKYLARGKGSRVWDVDGNEYIDCWLACLPITFGYCVPEIDNAIRDQLNSGITFSLMHPLEIEASKLISEDISIAEQVRFTKNGSDATEAAVRLARHLTNRNKVITLGYHGFHDWYISSTDRYYGIPHAISELTLRTSYNDIVGLKKLFESNKGEIACLIMEPAIFECPVNDYLHKVKEIVHENGALLIFDEMLTGYRFSRHGAMSFFGVEPDLVTLGKGIANGMPIGILAGPEKYMRGFNEVFLSSTYGGETLSLAAVVAGLKYHRENNVVEHMWKLGKVVLDGFNSVIKEHDLANYVSAIGFPVRQTLQFRNANGEPDYDLAGLFQQEMLIQGVLCNSGLGFSYAHTIDEAHFIVSAFNNAAIKMVTAINDGNIKKLLMGKPAMPVFKGLRDQKVTSN